MSWRGWVKIPTRKPMAILSALLGAGLVIASFGMNRDIPPGAASVLNALIGFCVGGYCGSSAWETGKKNES
jgi:hypothetical protein